MWVCTPVASAQPLTRHHCLVSTAVTAATAVAARSSSTTFRLGSRAVSRVFKGPVTQGSCFSCFWGWGSWGRGPRDLKPGDPRPGRRRDAAGPVLPGAAPGEAPPETPCEAAGAEHGGGPGIDEHDVREVGQAHCGGDQAHHGQVDPLGDAELVHHAHQDQHQGEDVPETHPRAVVHAAGRVQRRQPQQVPRLDDRGQHDGGGQRVRARQHGRSAGRRSASQAVSPSAATLNTAYTTSAMSLRSPPARDPTHPTPRPSSPTGA